MNGSKPKFRPWGCGWTFFLLLFLFFASPVWGETYFIDFSTDDIFQSAGPEGSPMIYYNGLTGYILGLVYQEDEAAWGVENGSGLIEFEYLDFQTDMYILRVVHKASGNPATCTIRMEGYFENYFFNHIITVANNSYQYDYMIFEISSVHFLGIFDLIVNAPETKYSIREISFFPMGEDSDSDGFSDLYEVDFGFDPMDVTSPGTAPIFYVNHGATGNSNGQTWTDAFTDLQVALNYAIAGTEIRVAEGTYRPGQTEGYPIYFQLKNQVTVKGGYGPDANGGYVRDIDVYQTRLMSYGGIVQPVFYHPDGLGLDHSAELNGVTILGGSGGGMRNVNNSPRLVRCLFRPDAIPGGGGTGRVVNEASSFPAFISCVFQDNVAMGEIGGAVYNENSSPTFISCEFNENEASDGGGAVWNESSTVTFDSCRFTGNSTDGAGGGVYNRDSSVAFSRCSFINHMSGYGRSSVYNNNSSLTMTSCLFAFNTNGRALTLDSSTGTVITNCTLVYNAEGIDIVESPGTVISNSILWGNSAGNISVSSLSDQPTVTYSDIEGSLYPGEGNINSDPLFQDPENGDFSFSAANSPCVDAGDPGSEFGEIHTDLLGFPRVINGRVDMGAFEYVFLEPPQLVYPGEGATEVRPTCSLRIFLPENTIPPVGVIFQIQEEAENGTQVYGATKQTLVSTVRVPDLVLNYGADYSWRAGLHFNGGTQAGMQDDEVTQWSPWRRFTIMAQVLPDTNDNTIPDDYEVDGDVDLDGDGTPDNAQVNQIKSVKYVNDENSVLVKMGVKPSQNKAFTVLPTDEVSPDTNPDQIPEYLPFGALTVKLEKKEIQDEDEVIKVRHYFDRIIPDSLDVFVEKGDGEWVEQPKSPYSIGTGNRPFVVLTFRDGDGSDLDGLKKNGTIVYKMAVGSRKARQMAADPVPPDDDVGGLGCFIGSL